jgi:hypothetical protein
MSGSLNSFKVSEHFNLKEFECPCCKRIMLEPHLVVCIEALRIAVKSKIIVNSGYRCPLHNLRIGGVSTSRHMIGQAADLSIKGSSPEKTLDLINKLGFQYSYYKADGDYYHVQIKI